MTYWTCLLPKDYSRMGVTIKLHRLEAAFLLSFPQRNSSKVIFPVNMGEKLQLMGNLWEFHRREGSYGPTLCISRWSWMSWTLAAISTKDTTSLSPKYGPGLLRTPCELGQPQITIKWPSSGDTRGLLRTSVGSASQMFTFCLSTMAQNLVRATTENPFSPLAEFFPLSQIQLLALILKVKETWPYSYANFQEFRDESHTYNTFLFHPEKPQQCRNELIYSISTLTLGIFFQRIVKEIRWHT